MADTRELPPSRPTTRRARSIHIPSLESLALHEPAREKQAESLRLDAYQIARILGRDIRIKLRTNTEKGLRELIWSCGVMMDKVLGGVESVGLSLHVPAALLDKLLIAVNMRTQSAQAPSIQQDTSLHNEPYQASESISTQSISTDSIQKDRIQSDRVGG